MKLQPASVRALVMRGALKTLNKTYAVAHEDFATALEVAPECALAIFNRGGERELACKCECMYALVPLIGCRSAGLARQALVAGPEVCCLRSTCRRPYPQCAVRALATWPPQCRTIPGCSRMTREATTMWST